VTNYGTTDKAESKDVEPDTWVLELEDVEKVSSRLLAKVRFSKRQFRSSKNIFHEGDVIYGKLRPYLDKVLVADESGVCTTEMIPVRGYACLVPSFLRLAMKSPSFIAYANESTHGMNLPRMGTAKARLALVPLLSEGEQVRIVAKVDELMALCNQLEQQQEAGITAHQTLVQTLLDALTAASERDGITAAWRRIADHFDTLFNTEWSIDQLKLTILQLAVMGKLVPQDPHDEPASELLRRIAVEKAQLVKDGKIKKQKALPAIKEDAKPFELPEGWEWCFFSQIAHQITDGAHHTPTYTDTGVPFLSVKDMSSGRLVFGDTKYISEDQHAELIKRCNPQEGDLLLTKVGTTGIPVLIDTDKAFSIFVSVALIKFPTDKISGDYLVMLINSPLVKKQSADGTRGIGNKNLVLRTISAFQLPIPPLAYQKRLVAEVNGLMAVCDTLKSNLNTGQTTQLHLADALTEHAVS
jgi:type I restriction enzyme S subunit